MRFETKMAVAVRADLETWQKLNVVAFLGTGLGQATDEVIGKPYLDADGTEYLALSREPVMCLAGDAAVLARTRARAVERGLRVAVYTRQMFETGWDEANRAAVAEVPADELDLVGIGIYGPRKEVDKAADRLKLHP
ncbi:hypothetical protein BIV57_06290 [Mangrovactinospora gilvigrisea]|uniref:DUF2000 domain-containing protein n=1 Tax=Mangrovactinospora gilvigrisea TaxID=1428644 RepID=A0A1J7BHY4_9ACTN|nr:DUF2000 domain-containing protein [Mangrovactinospora gilvigrisea]OIV38275.1 hypothetical protein BIV57_06290 [Mangrovactinospora gilvigrisea]